MLRRNVHIFLLLPFLITSVVFANTPSDVVPAPENNIVVAPVVTAADKAADAMIGALIADYKQGDPNALDIIRAELNKMQSDHQAKAAKDGVFLNTTYRLTPESLTFFAAIGLVTVNSMWIKSHGDPLAMEKHIQSLKDPVAHLSFYAFMLTNGFYTDFRTNSASFKASHPDTRARMMRRLNYQGMAMGSFASSIVADLGQSGKMCVDSWILGKNDEASIQSCNEAWKSWTLRNKFTQYFPQIISMWASQAVSDIVDQNGRLLYQRATTTELAKKLLNKEWLIKQAYKVTGADVALTFVGGTWAMKSIRLLGNLTKFTMFVGIDHFLSPFVFRPLNNLIRPLFFDYDAYQMDKFWKAYDDGNWDETKIKMPETKCLNPSAGIPVVGIALQFINRPKCDQSNLEKEIENYTVQVQQWREHLNADVEADLAGWMEMTKELLNQVDYSYKFYKTFSDSVFETLNTNYRIKQNPEDFELKNNKSNFPFRTLPLYGVSMGDAKAMGGAADDLYLNKPSEIEQRQKEHIKNVLASVEAALKNNKVLLSLDAGSLKLLKAILNKMASNDVNIVASGINDLNQHLAMTPVPNQANNYQVESNSPLFDVLTQLRNALGKPYPVVYPLAGFTQAFAANGPMKMVAEQADFSLWSISKSYKFSKQSDLMLYKLICGNKQASFDKTKVPFTDFDALAPQFDPPTLLKAGIETKSFCKKFQTTNTLFTTTIDGKNLSQFISENLNFDIIGDYRNKASSQNFDIWWKLAAEKIVAAEFRIYDNKFKELAIKAERNMFDQRSFYKWTVDHLNQSNYLKDSLVSQLKTETELYLQLIQRALVPADNKLNKKTSVYLKDTVASADSEQFKAVYGPTYTEVRLISDLINSFYPIMLQKNVDFKAYIKHSKKIDTAINDVLVAAGLKIKEKTAEIDILADPAATGTETSDTIYKDVKLKSLSLRQRVIVAAVKGLRQVESETRRFIRMKVMLSKGLEIDKEQLNNDISDQLRSQTSKQRSANPRGS